MTFHIGQQVICIREWSHELLARHGMVGPRKYALYTVRCYCPHAVMEPCILLNEIHNPPNAVFRVSLVEGEPSWPENTFRPVADLKTLFRLKVEEPA